MADAKDKVKIKQKLLLEEQKKKELAMKQLRNRPFVSKHKIRTWLEPGNKIDKILMEVYDYYNQMRKTNPAFFEFKKRNMDVINHLVNEGWEKKCSGMYGDILKQMTKAPRFFDEWLKMLKQIDLKLIMGKSEFGNLGLKEIRYNTDEMNWTEFVRGFKSVMKNPDADIFQFLDKHSFFENTPEDIISIYNCIQSPTKFTQTREKFGLSEERF